ncbi:MAG: hypothetical protein P8J45_14870 [Phycisphaerales bacterium]|jgi:lipid-binding SYLF domain-containing protein|nr:hypothetical protein [Phycisphaerales bacterium]
MSKLFLPIMFILATALALPACQVAPAQKDASTFNDDTEQLIQSIASKNPKIATFVDDAYGYTIFPVVGEGGLLFAGGWGRGAVYEDGTLVGYARVDEHSIGAVAGGEKWTLLIFFKDKAAFDNFKAGKFAWDAKANVVAGTAGTDISTDYSNGVILFRVDPTGAMGNASAGFSSYSYLSLEDARKEWKKDG